MPACRWSRLRRIAHTRKSIATLLHVCARASKAPAARRRRSSSKLRYRGLKPRSFAPARRGLLRWRRRRSASSRILCAKAAIAAGDLRKASLRTRVIAVQVALVVDDAPWRVAAGGKALRRVETQASGEEGNSNQKQGKDFQHADIHSFDFWGKNTAAREFLSSQR